MEHHVFAVWDFMSLLKAVQRRLCCNEIPGFLRGPCLRIHQRIVLAETDATARGFLSHFSLYIRAMAGCGADTSCVDRFLTDVSRGLPSP